MNLNRTLLRDDALAAHRAGICCIPTAEDGTKRPFDEWACYQTQRPSVDDLLRWYEVERRTGLFFVCGRVSGNLGCLEFDCRATFDAFLAAAAHAGLGDVVERVRDGCEDETPGGGVHWPFRCEEIGRNTALARRPKLPEEMRTPHDKVKVLIETREEGGGMIAAPSHGGVHPTGRAYRRVRGSVATVATITPAERAELYALARSFDRMPKPATHQPRDAGGSSGDGTRPGDDLNRRVPWIDILGPHGWTPLFERNGATYWRRPGKDWGVSATTDYRNNGLLWLFTSSTEFEPDTSYTRFGAFATLEFGGDFGAAARFLAARGYGTRAASSAAPAPGRHARFTTRTVRVA